MVEGEDFDMEDEDHDTKRATERMSLKHKTQSQWAKSMIKADYQKMPNRAELEEMLRQGEKLRTKQMGFEDGDQSDENADDIINEYDQDDIDDENNLRSKLGKGVMNMDFMKKLKLGKEKRI